MKINLTKKEYRLLLDLLSISDWVLSARKPEPDPGTTPYFDLQQKILGQAAEFGFDNLVQYDREYDQYHFTDEFDEKSEDRRLIEEYDEETFWDLLSWRLAERDLMDRLGADAAMAMDEIDWNSEIDQIAGGYLDEFEANGLRHLKINPDLSH